MDDKPVTISSYGAGSVTINNLTPEESERLRASVLAGHCWVRRDQNGRLEHSPSYETLPGPTADEDMLPFWRRPTAGTPRQGELFGFDESTEASLRHASPSIYITGLCGYRYSTANYQFQAEQLMSWGFVCMRSPRDFDSGRYWEVWFLPGCWAAKGHLKEALSGCRHKTDGETLKVALKFLRQEASFGSLDISMQRIAMVLED